MSKYRLIQGDCLKVLDNLPNVKAIFLDPPDNLGLNYEHYYDRKSDREYYDWFSDLITACLDKTRILWISYYHQHDLEVKSYPFNLVNLDVRTFIWRFTFGQYRETDCASGYRPILRIMKKGTRIYPENIKVISARMEQGDKRAAGLRVPDDVWDFPRVVGNAKERRSWHPTQHPEALMSRIIRLSCNQEETFCDLFAGTGTSLRVCQSLNIPCIAVELSPTYVSRIQEETGVTAER